MTAILTPPANKRERGRDAMSQGAPPCYGRRQAVPFSAPHMLSFFGSFIDQLLDYARAHEDWLPAVGFVFAFLKSLPLVALFVPGTALLVSVGALLGAGVGQGIYVWLAISIGAALGDWVAYVTGIRAGPALLQWAPLRRRPALIIRTAAFVDRWGVLSVVLCRFFGPLRATVPMLTGMFGMRAMSFQIANWASAFVWAAALLLPGWAGIALFNGG